MEDIHVLSEHDELSSCVQIGCGTNAICILKIKKNTLDSWKNMISSLNAKALIFFLKSSSKINSRGRDVCGNGGEEGYLGMMREELILDKFLVLLSFLQNRQCLFSLSRS